MICESMMPISATSNRVNSTANIQKVVMTHPEAMSVMATCVGIRSCTTHGCLPASATIQPHCEAM